MRVVGFVGSSGSGKTTLIGNLLPVLTGNLDDIEWGARSLHSWLMNNPFDTVPFEANGIDLFFNINTPSDWERANAGL